MWIFRRRRVAALTSVTCWACAQADRPTLPVGLCPSCTSRVRDTATREGQMFDSSGHRVSVSDDTAVDAWPGPTREAK